MEQPKNTVTEFKSEIIYLEENKMIKKLSLMSAMAAAAVASTHVSGNTLLAPFSSRFMGKRNFLKDSKGSKASQEEKINLAKEKREKKKENRLRSIALAERGKDYV